MKYIISLPDFSDINVRDVVEYNGVVYEAVKSKGSTTDDCGTCPFGSICDMDKIVPCNFKDIKFKPIV